MKYLRLYHPVTGDNPFLCGFGLDLMHVDLAEPWLKKGYTVKSAGFYHVDSSGGVVVHGHSHGLQVGPADDDAEFIARLNDVERRIYESTSGSIRAA